MLRNLKFQSWQSYKCIMISLCLGMTHKGNIEWMLVYPSGTNGAVKKALKDRNLCWFYHQTELPTECLQSARGVCGGKTLYINGLTTSQGTLVKIYFYTPAASWETTFHEMHLCSRTVKVFEGDQSSIWEVKLLIWPQWKGSIYILLMIIYSNILK